MMSGWDINSGSCKGSMSAFDYAQLFQQSASTYYVVVIDSLGPFRIKKSLYFDKEFTDDGVILSNDEADLYAAGKDMSEAIKDLQDELRIAWREYALCDDAELDSGARDYKRWLLENIEGPLQ